MKSADAKIDFGGSRKLANMRRRRRGGSRTSCCSSAACSDPRVEQLKIIEPLSNPTADGATAADAFHLVILSLPGYGFSGKPTEPGWNPPRIARAWAALMQHLGY